MYIFLYFSQHLFLIYLLYAYRSLNNDYLCFLTMYRIPTTPTPKGNNSYELTVIGNLAAIDRYIKR